MNEYFQTGAVPAPSSPGASSVMRQEFANIAAGFDKLPVLAGHANEIIFVDATGSRLETNGTVLTDFVTLAGTQELINKTIPWADNTFLGFNDAATKVAGTGAGQVLLLAEANKLPVLDGSLLTNLNQGSLSTVSIAKGGTGATDLTGAQVNLGINLKADANNTVLTGAPTAPTPLTGDASARIATTYFVADTMQAIGAFGPSSMNPLMNGIVSPGVAILGSRSDHVHPTDTSRAPVASPTFTGVPAAPTAAADTNTTQLATTAFMIGQAGASSPVMDGVAAVGTSVKFARQDHVHPTNTSRAPINSPTFTGTPAAPTPLTSDNTTKVATTAFVQSLLAQQPPAGMQPSNSTPLMDGTAAAGTGVEGSRYDHVHPSDTSKLSLSGGTLTGQLKGITPAAVDDLTRKDYVDTKLALSGGTLTGQLWGAQYTSFATWLPALGAGASAVGFNCYRSDKTTVAAGMGVYSINGESESYGFLGCGPTPWTSGLKVNTAGMAYNTVAGGAWVDWRTTRSAALQANCVLVDAAYTGLRFTTTGGTHFASIDADPSPTVGTATVLRIHVGATSNNLTLDGAGNLTALGNITAYSDAKLKKDLEVIPDALAKVLKLTGYTYTRIDTEQRQTGLIAQDVQAVLPEAVSESDGTLSLAYGNLAGLFAEAIKELVGELSAARQEIAQLRADAGL